MVPLVAAGVIWTGYLFLAYGWSQVRGCNAGLRDLAWPGRPISCNPDAEGGAPASSDTLPAGGKIPRGLAPVKSKKGIVTQTGHGPTPTPRGHPR